MSRSGRGGVRWMLIGWVFVLSAVSYLDRVNISIAGKFLAQEFQLDNVRLGNVFSAFILGYAFFQAPGGRLADRFGPRKVLTFGVIWWGVFTALTGAVPAGAAMALVTLLAVRFALGLGEAVMYPASNRLVSRWIPMGERGLANGLIFAGVGVGAGVTPPLVTYLLEHHGWRFTFFVCAAIGMAAAIVWYLIGRDSPEEHPWVSREEADHIRAGLPPVAASGAPAAQLRWGTILRDRNVLALTLSYVTFGYAAYIFFSWFFIYLNTVRGLNLRASGYYAMLPFLAMAVCSPLGGWIGDRVSRTRGRRAGRRVVAVSGMALAAVFIGLGSRVQSAELASVVLAGGAGALYLSLSSFWSVTADIGGASAGSVSGVMNMGNQVAGAITASLSPWIADRFGWNASFLVAAGLCALGAVAWLSVDPERPLRNST
ncbi:MAG: MFS transporter [Gemmatimonadetes bacterium]|nr:MFS transporter [Gemmatimonadota bacterium]